MTWTPDMPRYLPGGRRGLGDIRAYASDVLGPCTVETGDPRACSHVVALLDRRRRRWFVKHVPDGRKWQAEVRALQEWVPAIRRRAPRLHHVDHDRRMMTLSEVPGCPPRTFGAQAHRGAGELLRRLHGAVRPAPATQVPEEQRNHFAATLRAELVAGRQPWLADDEVAFVLAEIERGAAVADQPLVACHGDYRPANWIRDDRGTIHVIDFGQACREPWAFDLVRLALGPWWVRPVLAEAFLDGYGRQVSEEDRALVASQAAVHAVTLLSRAQERDDPALEERGRSRLRALMDGHPLVGA